MRNVTDETCSSCGTSLQPGVKFWGRCSAAVVARAESSLSGVAEAAQKQERERAFEHGLPADYPF